MQSSDTATGVLVNCLYHILVRSGMLETNKQVLIFKFGEDLSYFVILRYKLRDFIKRTCQDNVTPLIALSFPHFCPKLEQTLHIHQEQYS